MWIVENPALSGVGCVSRTKPDGSRDELQIEPCDFVVLTEDELIEWKMSPGFVALVKKGNIVVYESDEMPEGAPEIPESLKPTMQYDHNVAREIALGEAQDIQMARINLFREYDESTGRDWQERAKAPEMRYLKNRHLQVLLAAEWYLTEFVKSRFVGKRTRDQNARLRDIRRQIKKIKVLT